ncbi:MAG TPA: NAD(P)H-hydrate dehydratase, partial [Candidatus Thermoplasmatota archaeon]|nr:NAD(P)H-hydrate dehydratase [Candidatus Thermoplasmatota archaeon]
ATVIVKGRREVVSDGQRVARDEAGSPYLTKGGYGDLLAGAAGAMLARGQTPFDAARVAAHVVGRAGALAAQELGESTLASDALARVPQVLRDALG